MLIVEVAPELIGGTILPLNDQYLCFDPLAPPIIPPASLSVTNSIVDPLISYQWQESSDTISWTNIGGEVNQTFNPPVLTSSQTIYYRRMVRALGGGAGCEEFSTVHTLFVSDLDPGEIDTASNETYCFGTNPPIVEVQLMHLHHQDQSHINGKAEQLELHMLLLVVQPSIVMILEY